MTQDDSKKGKAGTEKEADHYTGMAAMDFAPTPSVIICGVAGAILGSVCGFRLMAPPKTR